jgi:hypothetical protein
LYSASATKHSQYKRSCFVEELSARIINLRKELQLVLVHQCNSKTLPLTKP